MPVYWPNGSLSAPRATSEFSLSRRNPVTGVVQPHLGIDIVGWTDVLSPVDGTVLFAGYNGGAGNEVRIRADGPTAFHVGDVFRLMHHATLYVRSGQRVTARQPVGRMGTTGNSTGVHCHFETHEFRLGNPINPRDFMARANSGSSAGGAGQETDMPLNEEDLKNIRYSVQRALQYEARPKGFGADGTHGPTLWERLDLLEKGVSALVKLVPQSVWAHLVTAQDGKGGAAMSGGKPVQFPASGFLASTNAAAQSGGVTEAQVKAIADAIVEASATPTVKVDYAAIAKAVNDDAARRLAS